VTNRSTSGGNAVPDTDSESLMHFLYCRRMEHFRVFVSISNTVTGRFHAAKRRQGTEFITFWQRSDGHPDPDLGSVQKSGLAHCE